MRTPEEIKAEVKAKNGPLDERDGTTAFDRELRTHAALYDISPCVSAQMALDRILGEQEFYIDELDEWVGFDATQYLESLQSELLYCVREGTDISISETDKNLTSGKKYLEYRAYVSRLFYREVQNAMEKKETLLSVCPSATPTSLETALLLKSSVDAWASKALGAGIPEWSLAQVEKPVDHVHPAIYSAMQKTKKARISVHITLVALGALLAKNNQADFGAQPSKSPYDFNIKAIATNAAETYSKIVADLDEDAPAKKGQGTDAIITRLNLGKKLLAKQRDKM
jgi:hypothetical protein